MRVLLSVLWSGPREAGKGNGRVLRDPDIRLPTGNFGSVGKPHIGPHDEDLVHRYECLTNINCALGAISTIWGRST